MASSLPLNTKIPVKQYLGQVRFKMNDGQIIEIQVDPTKRSIFIGAMNTLAQLYSNSFPTGLECTNIDIDIGNGFDVVK